MKTLLFWIFAIWFAAVVAGFFTYYFAPTAAVGRPFGLPSAQQ